MPKLAVLAPLFALIAAACGGSEPSTRPASPPEYERPSKPAPAATDAPASSASAASAPTSAPSASADAPVKEECTEYECVASSVTDAVKVKMEAQKDNPRFKLVLKETTNDDLKSLAKVPWLKNLEIRSDKVTDITPVAQLKSLVRFNAWSCGGITDIKPLAAHVELVEVNLFMTKVADITPLAKMTKIEELNLYATAVTDISTLKNLKKLKNLNLYMVKAQDWSPLAELTELEDIWLHFADIKDLKMLAKATKMRSLGLSWCEELADISAVKNRPDLQVLELTDTAVKSLAPAAGLKLQIVKLDGTKITDLSPLGASVKAKSLNSLSVSKSAGKAAEAFKKDLPNLYVSVSER